MALGLQAQLTYQQLDALSNRCARLIRNLGVVPGDAVCISGTKRLHTFAFMVGCLKAGAAYCVIDPDSPAERLRKIVDTCRPRALVGEGALTRKLADVAQALGAALVVSDDDTFERQLEGLVDGPLAESDIYTGAHPAYVMFTSGSTGFPKGAVMTHANVLNLIDWARDCYQITPDDVMTNVNALYFDNSVFDFFASLWNGATLVPFTRDEVRDPKALVDKLESMRCTSWFSVPSLLIFLQTMKATDGVRLRSIRRFIFGGEGYPKEKLKRLFDLYADGARFFNVYGPTECTCICSSYEVTADDFTDLTGLCPLGDMAPNFDCLILGNDDETVPDGEVGELCLLGPNVGRGYWNDPVRTRERFVQNPRNDRFPEIMYRTGDLVRRDSADGKVHIVGRQDNQIKHMGYRIEIEEIEAGINTLSYIDEAVVVYAQVNGAGRIVAYVAAESAPDPARFRQDLRAVLPDYMIPSQVHHRSVLPKNANGKLDRRAVAELAKEK